MSKPTYRTCVLDVIRNLQRNVVRDGGQARYLHISPEVQDEILEEIDHSQLTGVADFKSLKSLDTLFGMGVAVRIDLPTNWPVYITDRADA